VVDIVLFRANLYLRVRFDELAWEREKMKTFTIHSRKLNRDFTFNCNIDEKNPHHSKYVGLEEGVKTGILAPQICYGGRFMGNAVSSTAATFERDCRAWYRQYMAVCAVNA
jgi:hypothetical protein